MNDRIQRIISAKRVNMGGNWIEQPLPLGDLERIGPFLLIHHWQEVSPGNQSPLEIGVGPHPHRGFSPVTCIYAGALRHRDSLGTDHVVTAGGTQWMNSGSGIVHSERPSDELAESGGLLEMIQFWINTPKAFKMDPPSYQPLSTSSTPSWEENHWNLALVQGKLGTRSSPIKANHPLLICNLQCDVPGAKFSIPLNSEWIGAVYVLDGKAQIEGRPIEGRQMAILEKGQSSCVELECLDPVRVLFMSGAELLEPVFSHGPFVMNDIEGVQRAIMDYHDGKMGELTE